MTKLLFAAFLFFTSFTNLGWSTNFDAAKAEAAKEHKFILLSFSGSDWCIPCMRLEKDIFDNDAFITYAAQDLVLVNADFPRSNKQQLSKEQQKQNDALADRYNQQGSFPFTLLLDSNGNKIKVWDGYYKNGADHFVSEIKEAIAKQ